MSGPGPRERDGAPSEAMEPPDLAAASAVEAHCERLEAAFFEFADRTCARLCLALRLALDEHLALLDADELGPTVAGVPEPSSKDCALAGGLFLLLMTDVLRDLGAQTRELVTAAYLPVGGGTDRPPYQAFRLPDGLLAERVLRVRRGGARAAASELKDALRDILEVWWREYDARRLRLSDVSHALLARLAHALFRPTLYDVMRLDALRPQGRTDLDFVRWRTGSMDDRRRRRGRRDSARPTPLSEETVARWVAGTLAPAERRSLLLHLLWGIDAAEFRRLERATRRERTVVEVFEALVDRARAEASHWVAAREVAPAVVPALATLGASSDAGPQRALRVEVRPPAQDCWACAVARADDGEPVCVSPWRRITAGQGPTDLGGYQLDPDEQHAEVLVLVAWGEPPAVPGVAEMLGFADGLQSPLLSTWAASLGR